MDILSVILSVLLIIVCWASAMADFRRVPQVAETLTRLGVPLRMLPLLGVAKVAGGLGLLIGQWNDVLLTFAAVCLTIYFAVATILHVRAKDSAQATAPPAVLMLFSAAVFLISL